MSLRQLLLVRHAESIGNVAASAAQDADAEVVDVEVRDADTPLSDLGVLQAGALGAALRDLSADQQPDGVWCSPYQRAEQTARIALSAARLDLPIRFDERLRDRELGILDRLTSKGVEARYPEEAERRRWHGKFYHRPPGGESWADVALRLRTLLTDLERLESRRLLVVCHDATVLTLCYICERMTEAQVLELTRDTTLHNVSVTRLCRGEGKEWVRETFNDVTHLERFGLPVTEHPGDSRSVPVTG
jgi:broad specificity phosphatase PhoE